MKFSKRFEDVQTKSGGAQINSGGGGSDPLAPRGAATTCESRRGTHIKTLIDLLRVYIRCS